MITHTAHPKANTGMVDILVCSCGWESAPYFDGQEYAEREWLEHISQPAPELVKKLKTLVEESGVRFSLGSNKEYEKFKPLEKFGFIDCYDCMWGRYYYNLTDKGKRLIFK